jgi:hypothetical protein
MYTFPKLQESENIIKDVILQISESVVEEMMCNES